MSAGTAPPQPPFITPPFIVGSEGSPHPPRIKRRLELLFLLRLVLVFLFLSFFENLNREKNRLKVPIIYIKNKII
jgi:hypothetical protein